ncbi:MAG: amidohydrolase [Methanoregulaceae archaeon]|nr:amidohydrolase [Methanoregulaceae archaeon]
MADPVIGAAFSSLEKLYREFHAHPELSGQEEWTSRKLAGQLEDAGYTVTRGVGGYGVVALLENGPGPRVMLRADMDALPVREETGLSYQSRRRATDPKGREVEVMHACGHDLHMTALLGAARTFSTLRKHWAGTLMLIGQPSEETVSGAARMIGDGLYARFGRPEAALSFHVAPDLPGGVIGYREGIFTAGSESLDITVRGIGGHAAHPEQTRDPVVAAARMILAFQTIVSREVPPDEFAVLTVASVHGGLKHNAIPEEVVLQVNIRSFDPEIRDLLLAAIRRTADGVALSLGIPEELMPRIHLLPESVPPLVNDPVLTTRVAGAFIRSFGGNTVRRIKPLTGSEDFGLFAHADPPVPVCYFRLGCDDGTGNCGFLHSSRFSLDTSLIRTAVSAIVVAAAEVLDSPLR